MNERAQSLAPRRPAKAPGLRERAKLRKRSRIVAAARELFSRLGYEATSTRAIAARAGIATGTLFLYFPEKRDLLFHLFLGQMEEVLRRAMACVDADASVAAQVEGVFAAFLEHHARDRRLSRVFMREFLFVEQAERAEFLRFTVGLMGAVAGLYADAQARREVAPDVDPAALATLALAAYTLCLIAWQNGAIPTVPGARRNLRAALDLMLRGAGARAPRSTP